MSEIDFMPEPELSTGLCAICREDQALPDDDVCFDCLCELGFVHRGVDPADETEAA